ncbi:MAG: pectate lyase [Verrucomicrobiota bacterium]
MRDRLCCNQRLRRRSIVLSLFVALTPACGGGSAGGSGNGGATATGGSAMTGSGGAMNGSGGGNATGGAPATGGSPGSGGTASGGTPGTGGVTGATGGTTGATGGSAGGHGGTTGGTGGAGTATGGHAGTTGGGMAGSSGVTVHQSATCTVPTWPTPTGTPVSISGTKTVSGVYDGKMALHDGDLNDCTTGDQSSTHAIIEIADGGTVKNIVFGGHVGDGIHCLGSCTIDNVWFPYICDDAVTMLGGAGKTATITNSGFKGARDKTIQHNGDGSTVVIEHVYVETAGKLYRSCGQGCSSSETRTVKISNVVAVGASEVAGISTNDHATLSNICAYRTPSLCRTYKPGSETETTTGANGTNEGPDANCSYTGSDTHGLLNDVGSGAAGTDVLCPGPNSIKTGSTATACVSGFASCLKTCAPGGYGFKAVTCDAASGNYASNGPCLLPSDAATAAHFASTNASSATMTVTNNAACTSQWAWATDGAGKYCMCVYKPGYYQASSGWFVWDCQSQWW